VAIGDERRLSEEGAIGISENKKPLSIPQESIETHDLAGRDGWSGKREEAKALPASTSQINLLAKDDPPEPSSVSYRRSDQSADDATIIRRAPTSSHESNGTYVFTAVAGDNEESEVGLRTLRPCLVYPEGDVIQEEGRDCKSEGPTSAEYSLVESMENKNDESNFHMI